MEIYKLTPLTSLVWFQEGPGVRNTQYTNSGVKLLNVANLIDGHIDLSTSNRYIAEEEAYGRYRHLLCDKGDLVIASSGIKVDYFDKKMGFVRQEHLPLCMNTSTIRFKVLDKNILNIRYFMYFLKSNFFKSQLSKQITGSAQLNFGPSHLKRMIVPLINIDYQNHICGILDKVYELEYKLQTELTLLNQLVKSRFLEMFGMSEGIDKHLEDVADICSGITKGRKVLGLELREVPYMAVSNVKMGYIDLSTVKTIMATENEIEQYRLFPNDILMTEGGDPDKVGRGAIIRNPPKDCIHQNHIFRVRLHKDVLLPEFFEEYLQGNSARRYFLKAAKQTTGIASINMKQLRALPVKIPPIKVQIQYSDFVHQVDKSKLAVQKSLDELETLKKSLMQTYFG